MMIDFVALCTFDRGITPLFVLLVDSSGMAWVCFNMHQMRWYTFYDEQSQYTTTIIVWNVTYLLEGKVLLTRSLQEGLCHACWCRQLHLFFSDVLYMDGSHFWVTQFLHIFQNKKKYFFSIFGKCRGLYFFFYRNISGSKFAGIDR